MYPDSGDSEDIIDSREGGTEGFSADGELGAIGGLGIFPHIYCGHIFGILSAGFGNGQGPVSLFLALPIPEGG